MRPTLQRAFRAAGAVLLVLATAGAAHAAVSARGWDLALERLVDALRLHRTGDARERSDARDTLRRLGPDALPAAFAVLSGRSGVFGEGGPLLDREGEELLLEAIADWPTGKVLAGLEREIRRDSPLSERMLAVRLAGAAGDERGVETILDLYEGVAPEYRRDRRISRDFEEALASVLERERSSYDVLSGSLGGLDDGLLPSVASALGRAGSGRGLWALERMLGRTTALDEAVLEAMGQLNPWDPECASGSCARSARGYLSANDPQLRRQAAITLGRIHDADAAGELVELLGDDDRRVRRGALWALRRLSSRKLSEDQEVWERWLRAEEDWLERRAGELLASPSSFDPDKAVETLRELSEHSLYRHELAEELLPVLEHSDPNVAIAVCAAILRLGDPGVAEALAERLEDRRPSVRIAVGSCLSALTGVDLPPTFESWQAFFEG